jgi:hypothetical protein
VVSDKDSFGYILLAENIIEPPASYAIGYGRSTKGAASFGGTVNRNNTTWAFIIQLLLHLII